MSRKGYVGSWVWNNERSTELFENAKKLKREMILAKGKEVWLKRVIELKKIIANMEACNDNDWDEKRKRAVFNTELEFLFENAPIEWAKENIGKLLLISDLLDEAEDDEVLEDPDMKFYMKAEKAKEMFGIGEV